MDELINHLMHNPENTNPNVIRDMLQNISGSSSEEPNIEIFEGIQYSKEAMSTWIALPAKKDIEFLSIYSIENIKKGTISNLLGKIIYVTVPFGDGSVLSPADLETMYPLTTEQIDTLDTSGWSGYFYTFNKQVSVLFDEIGGRVYLTRDQINNDLTFIKKTGGLL